ncbi:Kinesin-associated protein 3 [Sarcoptes scabiei]|uniref:Kinesin-associated protein 3 n=1 Tax=Sarcoptes scabiei TaxID=52283 RepID=A0A834R766_SARSC|nr:Kinesin-associated protein 3 [Sarcoptes scabiei]
MTKIIFRKIKADCKNKCLIVYYDSVEDQPIGGGPSSPRACKQIIKINKSNENVKIDLEKIARKIWRKTTTIPYQNYHELVAELIQLEQKCSKDSIFLEYPVNVYNFMDFNWNDLDDVIKTSCDGYDSISIEALDSYIELLYEDLDEKIKGSCLIFKLISNCDCQEYFARNDTLLSALSRVFREDGKKSIDLSIFIAGIFGCLSKYRDFQFAITKHRVGSTCLEMIYFEVLRTESWLREINKSITKTENRTEDEIDQSTTAMNKSINQARSNGNFNEERLISERLSIVQQNLIKKQNTFFRYSLYILLNISEDLQLEFKIQSKGIVMILGKLLERNNQELLLIVILFLKKLSVFKENKQQMQEIAIYKNLSSLLYLDHNILVLNTLKLIYNLMLDHDIRLFYIRVGIFPKLVSFLSKNRYASNVISILFLISCERKYLDIFKQHLVINELMRIILAKIDCQTILEKLLVNLACDQEIAKLLMEHKNFKEFSRNTIESNRLEALQLIRNLSCHRVRAIRSMLMAEINVLIESMMIIANDPQQNIRLISMILFEYTSILTNLCASSSNETDWFEIIKRYSILDFLKRYSQKTIDNQNDRNIFQQSLSSVVLMFGKMIISVNVIKISDDQNKLIDFLLENKTIDFFLNLINVNQENDAIVSNSVYCLFAIVKQSQGLRKKISEDSKLVDYLIELMYDNNYKISTMCTYTMDLISMEDQKLFNRIRNEKFNAYNSKWLSIVQMDRSLEESNQQMLEDMFIYPDLFLKIDSLNDSGSDNFSDENFVQDNLVLNQ